MQIEVSLGEYVYLLKDHAVTHLMLVPMNFRALVLNMQGDQRKEIWKFMLYLFYLFKNMKLVKGLSFRS